MTSVEVARFRMCALRSRGGAVIISSCAGSNVSAVSGSISARRSIARICIARIGMAQFFMDTAASPKRTTASSAAFVVIEASTVFLRFS